MFAFKLFFWNSEKQRLSYEILSATKYTKSACFKKKKRTRISCLSLQKIQLFAFWPDHSDSGDIWQSASYQAPWSKKIQQTSCRICRTYSRIPACVSSYVFLIVVYMPWRCCSSAFFRKVLKLYPLPFLLNTIRNVPYPKINHGC